MANRYLIVSDLHICDIEDNKNKWKYYKSKIFNFDKQFLELVTSFEKESNKTDKLTLILNGDIFDFDLVTKVPKNPLWKVNLQEKRRGLKATAEKSAWKLEKIINDHPVFIESLAKFLSNGNKIVYILGNHDREFYFGNVKNVLLDAIKKKAKDKDLKINLKKFIFEPWFYYVKDQVYVEHGQQYDYYTSFKYILHPVVRQNKQLQIALPMGNISNRYLMSNMGHFNPHATDYIMNVYSYVLHWFRYYLFTTKSLLINWFMGSFAVMAKLLRIKEKLLKKPLNYQYKINKFRTKYKLSEDQIKKLQKLHRDPIIYTFFRVIREFWIDRLIISILMVGGTFTLALLPIPVWIKFMVPLSSFPLIFFIYELIAEGENVFSAEQKVPKYAKKISKILNTKIIVFGHTHFPRIFPISNNVSFIDSGTWAPITKKRSKTLLEDGYRNYLIISFKDDKYQIFFDCWK